jgi:PhnB protein
MTKLSPYLNFRDNAREAMEFYQSIFGGELSIHTFKDYHAAQDASEENLVMHAALESKSIMFMGSDTPKRMEYTAGTNFNMSLTGEMSDEVELRSYFEKLAEGGKVSMPVEKAIWGDIFGMCTDKFGIQWLINISGAKE